MEMSLLNCIPLILALAITKAKKEKKLAPLQVIEFLILRLLNFTYNHKVEAIIPIFISEKNEV